ncbi:MAG: hypothetical protein PHH30_02280 [Bacteroidales bacterium]|nr:hypothetical protein [Bacteroidales bacterium]MDD3859507.1 hypothetical protein [Bacteroidales bacterium]
MGRTGNSITALIIILSLSIYSCKNSNKTEEQKNDSSSRYDYSGDKLVITDKIMYDVNIVNDIIGDRTKNSPDWFWENLPMPESDEFVKTLLKDAYSGKLKSYYYDMTGNYESFDIIPQSELKSYMDDVMTYEIEIVDTTVKRYKTEIINIPLDYKTVKKLRFLEEWFIAEGKFYKRVIAVAPYFVIEYPGIEPINAVYFWVMLDERNVSQ